MKEELLLICTNYDRGGNKLITILDNLLLPINDQSISYLKSINSNYWGYLVDGNGLQNKNTVATAASP